MLKVGYVTNPTRRVAGAKGLVRGNGKKQLKNAYVIKGIRSSEH